MVLLCVPAIGAERDPSGKAWTNPRDGSEMVHVRAGRFKMGGKPGYEGGMVHEVSVVSFYIGKHEVTNRQFRAFVDANPKWHKDRIDRKLHDGNYLKHWDDDTYPMGQADHPVVNVSWFAAKAYCEWVGGRLPTEAEWEYACRAGSTTTFCFGDDSDQLDAYAWYDNNSDGSTRTVGRKKASKWGIHDMHGNAWEWCSSKVEPYPYRADDGREDPTDADSRRILRGGGWSFSGYYCRSAGRRFSVPTNCLYYAGFRVCISAKASK